MAFIKLSLNRRTIKTLLIYRYKLTSCAGGKETGIEGFKKDFKIIYKIVRFSYKSPKNYIFFFVNHRQRIFVKFDRKANLKRNEIKLD